VGKTTRGASLPTVRSWPLRSAPVTPPAGSQPGVGVSRQAALHLHYAGETSGSNTMGACLACHAVRRHRPGIAGHARAIGEANSSFGRYRTGGEWLRTPDTGTGLRPADVLAASRMSDAPRSKTPVLADLTIGKTDELCSDKSLVTPPIGGRSVNADRK
jgi:hypothetical protein